jgi:hypothetical protein
VEKLRKVLNVGGNNKFIPLPPVYSGWEHILLDIDPLGAPDIIGDARNLETLPAKEYDAVYCSHNLEHFYNHEAPKILHGFLHVLKDDGFVHICVPDLKELMCKVVQNNLDMDDILYHAPAGTPVLVRDVIYGWEAQMRKSGNDFYSHKNGFTPLSLRKILHQTGFLHVYVGNRNLEVTGIAFKNSPSGYYKRLLDLPEIP